VRIGFVCPRFFPPDGSVGGIEVFVVTLAERLQRLGHHAVVIAPATAGWRGPALDNVRGISVYRFAASEIRPRFLSWRLQCQHMVEQTVRKEKLDLVECCDEGGMLLSKRFARPLVVRMHQNNMVRRRQMGRPPSPIGDFFVRRLLRMADVRVGVSDWVARMTLETAGLNYSDYRVIYNGVDTTLFSPRPAGRNGCLRLLFVGRLAPGKGFPVLLGALPKVVETVPAVRLRCIGSDPLRSAERCVSGLPQQARSLVELAGCVAHELMPDEYRGATLFVLPSEREGLPITVLEAMACGVPVIFMRDGVGPEVITHGVDGLLCDTRDPASLANAILEALSSSDLRRSLGARARQKVEARFSLDKATDENVRLYEELVQRSRRG